MSLIVDVMLDEYSKIVNEKTRELQIKNLFTVAIELSWRSLVKKLLNNKVGSSFAKKTPIRLIPIN
jgi:hypothetical protein